MNSTLIRQKFGTYGVEVLVQQPDLRIASLYSLESDQRVTRSLAIVDYMNHEASVVANVHEQISKGGSIGQSFIDDGFEVVKQTEALVALAPNDHFSGLYRMMKLKAAQELTYHSYVLNVRKVGDWVSYARVTEVHSPDHLKLDDLIEQFGDEAICGEDHPKLSGAMKNFYRFVSQHVEAV